MHFTSVEPVILVAVGHYNDRNNRDQPMRRADGTIVEYLEVIGVGAPHGTPVTQIPCGPDVETTRLRPGATAKISLHVRTEHKAMMGRNNTPYTATQTKLRVVGVEVVKDAVAQAA